MTRQFSTTFALCAIALLAFVLPRSASAADTNRGDAILIPTGSSGKGLRLNGVKIRPLGSAKVLTAGVQVPIADLTFPKPGQALGIASGGFRLTAGSSKVDVKGLLLKVTGSKVTISGKVGTKRVDLFGASAGKKTVIDSGKLALTVNSKGFALTARAATALSKALPGKKFKAAKLGTLKGSVSQFFPPLPGGGSKGPADQKPWDEPVLPTQPGTAVPVSAPSLDWWARDSWVNYVGQAAQTSGGATSLGTTTNDPGHPCKSSGADGSRSGNYEFAYPFTSGWWDSASGTGVIHFAGSVRFYYPGRFDMSFADPQIVIRPSGTTMNFRIIDSVYPSGRYAEMFNVEAGLAPNAGAKFLHNTLTQVGITGPFGGFYSTDPAWGCMTTSFSA